MYVMNVAAVPGEVIGVAARALLIGGAAVLGVSRAPGGA